MLAIVALVALGTGAVASHDAQELSLPGEPDLGPDRFGSAVTVDGERALVGAPAAEREAWPGGGAVYEYTWNGDEWYQSGRITPPNSSAWAFGSSVALDGDTLLVGAEASRVQGTKGGAVYEYAWTGDTWEHQSRISLGKFTETGQRFGRGVALDGDVALIGAPRTEVSGQSEAGEVWMYERKDGDWVREEQITLQPPQEEAQFGSSVSLDGDVALVGAEQISGKVPEQGIVYEYRYDGDWTREDLIQLDGASEGDRFGSSVSLDGDRALVGAEGVSGSEVYEKEAAGAVYLYQREAGGWEQQGEALTYSGPSDHDRFGSGAAFVGEGALIGARGATIEAQPAAGAAYVFALESGDWEREQSLDIRGEVLGLADFGEAVAVTEDRLLVAMGGYSSHHGAHTFVQNDAGAWIHEDKLTVEGSIKSVDLVDGTALLGVPDGFGSPDNPGAAYVFTHDGFGSWNEQARIPVPDPQTVNHFGKAVSLGEDRALIGFEDAEVDGQAEAGVAYVFERSSTGTWTQEARIPNPTPAEEEHFGNALDLHGDTAIVGAHQEEVEGHQRAGAAYVFAEQADGTWAQQARLLDPEPSEDARFGGTAVMGDAWAVVGSPREGVGGVDEAGAVHVFSRSQQDGWTHQARLVAPEPAEGARFGHALALDGSTLLVGAQAEVDGAANAGTAYVFAADGTGTWTLRDEVPHPRPEAGDRFGSALALDGTTGLAGAPGRDVGARSDVGGAYLHTVDTLAASFTYEPASGIGPGDEVVFTDESTGSVASREWSFGDGTTSTDPGPQRSFSAGTHQVCLEVEDEVGHADEVCRTLEVLGDGESPSTTDGEPGDGALSPSVDSDEASPGDPVTFTADGADGDTTVSWDFGDGQTATGSPVTHTYDEPGTYTVTMTTEDENGQRTTQSIEVEVGGGSPLAGWWPWLLGLGVVLLAGIAWSRGREPRTPSGGPGQQAWGEDASGGDGGDEGST